ncbi:hypothetical protein FHS18_004291 [Paenibacillus phyllosphaerae]|uniref:Uncharacterized protein n=1 Tax=Paenibacillus phyllosphaerae TaxID=274593 RepID=A0A7W5B0K5_9BACL|nr:hypothetical protein [Paenibacillus phyllosphaerae]MBB3112205.1 hypothetical protein [Paenibacillus phyllosphaerae]
MEREWTFEITTKKRKVLLWVVLIPLALLFVWVIRVPADVKEITLTEVKWSGDKLIIDGEFNNKFDRYKGYSIVHTNSGYVKLKIYAGLIGKRKIHIETRETKLNSVCFYRKGSVKPEDLIRPTG